MPTPIPPVLTPYIAPAPEGSLTLITSVLDATSNWLVLRYIHAALEHHGVDEDPEKRAFPISSSGDRLQGNVNVIFVSVLRGFEQWREMGKKLGLDFVSLISTRRLAYISGLDNYGLLPSPLHDTNVVTFDLGDLRNLQDRVGGCIERETNGFRSILIMDGLDFLIASQPSITSLTLSRTIMILRQQVHSIVVTSSADYPLLHNLSSSATPLESEHQAFIATMAHQARMVLQLRRLGTGAAKDISGIIRVSSGGGHDDLVKEIAVCDEGEWLYQVKGDGNVKVWRRGE